MKRLIAFLLLLSSLSLLAQNSARMLSGVNQQAGITYTFVAQDSTRLTTFNNVAPIAATLPSGLTSGFSTGTLFSVLNVGSGQLTITCQGCLIFSNGSTGSATLVLGGGQGADIYSAGQNYWAQPGAGSGGVSNPLNVQNLNVAGTANLNGPSNFVTGFNSQGPGNWQGGFPAFGSPPDPFCAYMVQNGWWQMCGMTDPNNGTTVCAFNDGIGTPNINNFCMMTDSLPSFQPSGVIPCWNPVTGAYSFSINCSLPKGNSGGTGQGALWSDATHIYGDLAYLFAHTAQGTGSDVFVLSLGVTSAAPNGSTGAIQFGTLGNAKPAVTIMPAGVTCPFGFCVGIPEVTGTIVVSASAPLAEDANGNLTCPTCTTTAASIDLTAQSAAVGTTNLYLPPTTRMYRVSGYLKVTTPATTSSILAGTTGVTIFFTDGTDSVAATATMSETNQAGNNIAVGTGNTGNATSTITVLGPTTVFAKTGVQMQYNIGYQSTGGTAMQYEAHLRVEPI